MSFLVSNRRGVCAIRTRIYLPTFPELNPLLPSQPRSPLLRGSSQPPCAFSLPPAPCPRLLSPRPSPPPTPARTLATSPLSPILAACAFLPSSCLASVQHRPPVFFTPLAPLQPPLPPGNLLTLTHSSPTPRTLPPRLYPIAQLERTACRLGRALTG